VKLKLNEIYQLLAYADCVIIVRNYIDDRRKSSKTLIDARKDFGLEVKLEETKYTSLCHQNAGQNHDLKIAKKSY
jgi:hypothetical protein